MSGQGADRYRTLTVWSVMMVAAIAAAVSFMHIESLAIRYGQPVLAAWLLPLSIDGTVAVSSLAMLRAARAAVTAPWLARAMLLLAVGATLACNVGYGVSHGWPGALLSGWPAVAFVGCAEISISMSRRTGVRKARHEAVPEATAAARRKRAPASSSPVKEHAPSGRAPVTAEHAELAFGARLAEGDVPSLREVKSTLRLGTDRARQIRTHLLCLGGAGMSTTSEHNGFGTERSSAPDPVTDESVTWQPALRAIEAATEVQLSEAHSPAYLEMTGVGTIKRMPVIPVALHRANLRGTVAQSAGLGWHRTRYHGVRFPVYVLAYLWHAVRGGAVLTARLVVWWHWLDGHILVSQAVAAGRPGHQHAMSAHTEGRKVRKSRGQIIAVCGGLVLIAGLILARFSPWWGWVVLGVVVLAVLERHGRKPGRSLIQPAVVAPKYEPPTPQIITRALGSLGIAGINEVVRDGRGITFVTDVHRDGEGWSADLDLPHGVTSRMILAKREQLASGLRRPLSATWPEPVSHEHEGRLRLWIGFRDISKVKPPAWPLARSGQADIFGPFPFGTDPRGRRVEISLFENNVLVGAAPGQGKTSAVRVLACSAALDPLTELWVHELAGKGDLEPLATVSHRYISGLDDEAVGYAAASLRMLRAELERRSQAMKKLPKEARPDGKITRAMSARRSLRLFPLVCIVDECQNLFAHDRHGDQAKDDAAYVIRLGRAYGIILVLATQRPDSQMLPTAISGNVTLRFCLKVPGQIENDLILGTSSYRNGFNATVFRPKVDAGLGWLKAEGDPQVCRTYYLDLPAAERICERARVLRGQAGTLTGYALGQDDDEPARSFAADVLAVFGNEDKLWSATIAARLAEQMAAVYADITPAAVTSQLRALGVTVKNIREPGGAPGQGCERNAVEATTP